MLLFSDEKMRKLLPVKQSSALESIYAFLRKSKEMAGPQIEIAMAHSKYSDSAECYHEAGYDAYITGNERNAM